MLHGIFAAHAHSAGSPQETLKNVNQALARRAVESRFATVLYGVVERDGLFRYSLAGHNPPLLLTSGGILRLESGGSILGVFKDAVFSEGSVQLAGGDVLIAFSDGVTDAANADGELFGDDRLIACIEEGRQLEAPLLIDRLFASIAEFTGGAPQSDDITALVLRYFGA